jgi:hypothetical protein
MEENLYNDDAIKFEPINQNNDEWETDPEYEDEDEDDEDEED